MIQVIPGLTAPREAGLTQIWGKSNLGMGCRIFSTVWEFRKSSRHPSKPALLVSPFKLNYSVSLVNIHLIETVREYFVSTRCQKRPRGVIAYQLLTLCSIDSAAQSLQSPHRFTFIVILRGFNSFTTSWPRYSK